jgi:glutamate/tyrosine decarboxylase-like PLP-dependent enzyme
MIENEHAKQSVKHYTGLLLDLSERLAEHSIPFFSHRYAAHMNSETTLPAMLGYLIGMVHNQNNVAPEGGPLTALLEYEVGEDLCKMLGFTPQVQTSKPWGHLTAGGSISNLEAMW